MKWRLPPFLARTLRWRLREAPVGAEVVIDEPGEYEGPFILDRPIRLVGLVHDPRGVTFWTKRGPVIIVRSPDVVLESLNIEVTWSEDPQQDIAIVYAPGCMPYIQAELQGRVKPMATANNSSGWRLPDLIDLGDIRAKYPVTLPMLIQTPGPAQLSSDLSGMTVVPTDTPAGEHLIQVAIPGDRLSKDTMLAGQLVVQSGNETRTVWVIGRVLEDEFQNWVKDKIQLTASSQRKFTCRLGMVLGRNTLAGEVGADRLDDIQAYLRKEESGVWSLFQPRPVSAPLQVDGRPVAIGQRLILTGGETIELGALKLKVETERTDLALEVSGSVDFGRLSARSMAYLNVKKHSPQTWTGQLKAMVPWIVVPQPQVRCPAHQTIQVPVQLGSGVPGEVEQLIVLTGALVLENAQEIWAISAQVFVDIKDGLELSPRTLDWGQVGDPHYAPVQHLRLKNTGRQLWQGVASVAQPWLSINSTTLQCAPGAETLIEVRLNDQVARLPDGPVSVAAAVVIEGQQQRVVAAGQFHYKQPRAQIGLQPKILDWGKVTNWQAATPQTIQINNTGDKDWQGQVEVKVAWLDVRPAIVQCPAGGQATLTVQLNAEALQLPTFLQKVPAAVQLVGEDTTVAVLVRVKMEPPLIQLVPERVNIILADRNRLPRYFVQIHNQGAQPWSGVVTTPYRWLTVIPSVVTCSAGGSATVEIVLNETVNKTFRTPRVVEDLPDIIRIKGDSVQLALAGRLEIRNDFIASQSTILPAGLKVDFGTITDFSGGFPVREVRFVNLNPHLLQGTVRVNNLPWLEVTPTVVSCPSGQEVVLTVRLNQAVSTIRAKRYDVDDAIILESNGQQQRVAVSMDIQRSQKSSSSKLATVLQMLTFSPAFLDFGAVSKQSEDLPTCILELQNHSAIHWSGTVTSTLPWLEVAPPQVNCPPGGAVNITARLNQQALRLHPRPYAVSDAIELEGADQKYHVEVCVIVSRT